MERKELCGLVADMARGLQTIWLICDREVRIGETFSDGMLETVRDNAAGILEDAEKLRQSLETWSDQINGDVVRHGSISAASHCEALLSLAENVGVGIQTVYDTPELSRFHPSAWWDGVCRRAQEKLNGIDLQALAAAATVEIRRFFPEPQSRSDRFREIKQRARDRYIARVGTVRVVRNETVPAAVLDEAGAVPPNRNPSFNDVVTANGPRLLYAKLKERADQPVPWDNLPDEAFRDRNNVDIDTKHEALRTLQKTLNSKLCGYGQFGTLSISAKNKTATLILSPQK